MNFSDEMRAVRDATINEERKKEAKLVKRSEEDVLRDYILHLYKKIKVDIRKDIEKGSGAEGGVSLDTNYWEVSRDYYRGIVSNSEKYFSMSYHNYEYRIQVKLINCKFSTGIFSNHLKISLLPAGKYIFDNLNELAKKDGFSIDFVPFIPDGLHGKYFLNSFNSLNLLDDKHFNCRWAHIFVKYKL